MSSPHRPMLGIIGGTGMAEALGSLGSGEHTRVDTPFGPPSSPITVVEIAGAPVALLPRHGEGHRFPPGTVPTGPTSSRSRRWGSPTCSPPRRWALSARRSAPASWWCRTRSSTAPSVGRPPSSRPRGPRRARSAVLPAARKALLAAGCGGARVHDGGPTSAWRVRSSRPARRATSIALGRAPHRHDPDARGEARPRGRALLRGGRPGHRLRLLARTQRAGRPELLEEIVGNLQTTTAAALALLRAALPARAVAGGLRVHLPGVAGAGDLHLGNPRSTRTHGRSWTPPAARAREPIAAAHS